MDDKHEVIVIGKKCTAILSKFVKLVFAGNPKEAMEELSKLKNTGDRFALHVDKLLHKQEVFESYFITKEEASKRDISECIHSLINLKEELVSMFSVLERNVVLMSYFKHNLESAVDKFLHVEDEVKVHHKHRSVLPVANSNGDSKDHLQDTSHYHIDTKLKTTVENHKQEYEAAEVKVAILQEDIKGKKLRIQQMKQNLDSLQREKSAYQKRLSTIQDKISFLEQAVELWSLMRHVSDENASLEELSSAIFKKATEKTRSIVYSGPTKKIAHTFIEAWDSELVQAERGSSNILNFSFTCGKCGKVSSSIPHVKKRTLHCVTCHSMQKSPARLPQ